MCLDQYVSIDYFYESITLHVHCIVALCVALILEALVTELLPVEIQQDG